MYITRCGWDFTAKVAAAVGVKRRVNISGTSIEEELFIVCAPWMSGGGKHRNDIWREKVDCYFENSQFNPFHLLLGSYT